MQYTVLPDHLGRDSKRHLGLVPRLHRALCSTLSTVCVCRCQHVSGTYDDSLLLSAARAWQNRMLGGLMVGLLVRAMHIARPLPLALSPAVRCAKGTDNK